MEYQLRPALEQRHRAKAQQTLRTMWIMVATGETNMQSTLMHSIPARR